MSRCRRGSCLRGCARSLDLGFIWCEDGGFNSGEMGKTVRIQGWRRFKGFYFVVFGFFLYYFYMVTFVVMILPIIFQTYTHLYD